MKEHYVEERMKEKQYIEYLGSELKNLQEQYTLLKEIVVSNNSFINNYLQQNKKDELLEKEEVNSPIQPSHKTLNNKMTGLHRLRTIT